MTMHLASFLHCPPSNIGAYSRLRAISSLIIPRECHHPQPPPTCLTSHLQLAILKHFLIQPCQINGQCHVSLCDPQVNSFDVYQKPYYLDRPPILNRGHHGTWDTHDTPPLLALNNTHGLGIQTIYKYTFKQSLLHQSD
jgi:hypothetical protein